jgi:hypothetical protein
MEPVKEVNLEHTPGPWLCHKYPDTKGHTISHYAVGSLASVKHPSPDTQEANARLIAAAPDLLAALQEYVSGDDCDVDGAPDADNRNHSVTCRYCRAMTAIAKARSLSLLGDQR